MDIIEYLKILIASAGGTVVVMLAFSRRIFNVIESRIISGLQNALDKDLEKFKALTDNKKHVTQYRFRPCLKNKSCTILQDCVSCVHGNKKA